MVENSDARGVNEPVTLYFDASSYKDDSVTYLAYCIKEQGGKWLEKDRIKEGKFINSTQAEYRALIHGLRVLEEKYDVSYVRITGDCEGVIRIIDPRKDMTPTSDEIREYAREATALLESLDCVSYNLIPREQNTAAHGIASYGFHNGVKIHARESEAVILSD